MYVSRKRFISIFSHNIHLEGGPAGGIQYQKLLEQILTVGGHVKGNPIFPSQNTFPEENES